MKKGVNFDPDQDIPSLTGKVILITGGNNGIGKQAALSFAKHGPAELWIATRSAERGEAAVKEIEAVASPGTAVKFLHLDLASFASIKKASKEFLASTSRLDILMLNAGIFGGPLTTTEDGYELRWGTNHMGHALLTKLLMPLLLQTAIGKDPKDVRVVVLSSSGYSHGRCLDPETLRKPTDAIIAYPESKLSNLYFAKELAVQYPQFTSVSLDPGNITTDLFEVNGAGWKLWLLKTIIVPLVGLPVEKGALNSLWCSTTEDITSGAYYSPVGILPDLAACAKNEEYQKKLWNWTQKELEGHTI